MVLLISALSSIRYRHLFSGLLLGTRNIWLETFTSRRFVVRRSNPRRTAITFFSGTGLTRRAATGCCFLKRLLSWNSSVLYEEASERIRGERYELNSCAQQKRTRRDFSIPIFNFPYNLRGLPCTYCYGTITVTCFVQRTHSTSNKNLFWPIHEK